MTPHASHSGRDSASPGRDTAPRRPWPLGLTVLAWVTPLASLTLVALVALFAWVAPTAAQSEPTVVSDGFVPALDDHGFISLPGTVTPGHMRASLTLGSDLGFDQRQVPLAPAGERVQLDRVWRTMFGLQLGLGPRLAVALAIPAFFQQHGEIEQIDSDPMGGAGGATTRLATRRQGFGDTRIQARYRLFGNVADNTGVKADGPGLGVLVAFDLPTGDRAAYTGEGMARSELSALADFQVLGAAAGLKLGWLHRPVPRITNYGDGRRYKLQDRFLYGFGVRMPMPFMPTLSALLELRGEADFADADSAPLELLLGGRLRLGGWSVSLAGGARLASAYGTPAGRLVATVRLTPKDPDVDGDGIPDKVDACPLLPEDMDGFLDGDGCEDPDNDNDLVPDVDDLCPNEEAEIDRDLDEDGCTDP